MIDGDGVSTAPWVNWTWASTRLWCDGRGTITNPYVIADLTIDAKNTDSGIYIQNSIAYFMIKNCELTNAPSGGDAGIQLDNVANGTIIGNNLTDNYVGIHLDDSNNNTILENTIVDNNGQGIILSYSKLNLIQGNTGIRNRYYNLLLSSQSNNNTIINNTFNNSTYLGNPDYGSGIKFSGSIENCEIIGNTLNYNNYGIRMAGVANKNKVYNNIIENNNVYGVYLHEISMNTCNATLLFNNTFDNPLGINAYDNGTNTEWSLGTLGNYWDDYPFDDLDDNGIGDTPYLIDGESGSQDNYPIWEDGDDTAPILTINSPSEGTIFGSVAPTFNLTIFDINLNLGWYTVEDNATKNSFSVINGINIILMNPFIWNGLPEGDIIIRFFVNDTEGNVKNNNLTINKQLPSEEDTDPPSIILNYPLEGAIFGVDAPTFNLTIYDLSLNMSWYTIGTNITKYFFSVINGINIILINQSGWDAESQGAIDLIFYVNDTAGNENNLSVTVYKSLSPIIILNSPLEDSVFGLDAPSFNLTILDVNLHMAWYTFDSDTRKYFFSVINGMNIIPLNQTAWEALTEGDIIINFYVNDTTGNTNNLTVTINKDLPPDGDLDPPSIVLNYPLAGTVFGVDAPTFNLTIYDLSLNMSWFTIGTDATKHYFSVINGTNLIPLSQVVWEALAEGDIVLRFYVNDTAGNINSLTVTINKDLPSGGGGGIPFGNNFLLITGITVALLIIIVRRKKIRLK